MSNIQEGRVARDLLMEARLAPVEVESEENHSGHVDGSCKCQAAVPNDLECVGL